MSDLIKNCPVFNKVCDKEECMAYEKIEQEVPEGYPQERLIRYEKGKPITPTKILIVEKCKYLESKTR